MAYLLTFQSFLMFLLCLIAILPQTEACVIPEDAPATYSMRMAYSIISRGQGVMSGQGGSSEFLETGITQKVFRYWIEQHAHREGISECADYIRKSVDSVASSLSNATRDTVYPLDRLSNGNNLIKAYQETQNETYKAAFEALRESINLQNRNPDGGLWYYIYPEWSYLDGIYSLAPFYTSYTLLYNYTDGGRAISDTMRQFDLLWMHCFDNSTGLLFHGYDFSKTAIWANPLTGASPHVWGRSLGWYLMTLADMLDVRPTTTEWYQYRSKFQRLADAVVKAVDAKSGAWWQVLDQPGKEGNYIESSGSSMFVYALLKGLRLEYLEDRGDYANIAARAYSYIVDHFVVDNKNGTLGFDGTVSVCSLNSTASYEYYVSRPILYNSVIGSAAFVLASVEHEIHTAK